MKYSDLVKNRVAVDHILKFQAKVGNSLVSRSDKNAKAWFELDVSSANTSGEVKLEFFYEKDSDIVAVVNIKDRTISVTGSEKFDITKNVTEQVLQNCFKNVISKGMH